MRPVLYHSAFEDLHDYQSDHANEENGGAERNGCADRRWLRDEKVTGKGRHEAEYKLQSVQVIGFVRFFLPAFFFQVQ
jgi:hypothetical protein